MGNIGFNSRTEYSVQSNKKGKKKEPRDQLSSPDDDEDTPLDDQPNHKVREFETHAHYVEWFQSLSNYKIQPKVTNSITTRTQKFADPPNLKTFPYYRIFYKCCGNNSCGLVLKYKFKPVSTLPLKGKILVEFDPGRLIDFYTYVYIYMFIHCACIPVNLTISGYFHSRCTSDAHAYR
jgi:hypothetical protein